MGVESMMSMNTSVNQQEIELVMLEQLVKEDHLLRSIDKYINFSFIYNEVEYLYSDIGRPSIDPVTLFKMLLIKDLYGISSERRLMQEIHHNMAYRWFLGYGITTKVPDHSIFSQNKIRRFRESTIFEDIFIEIVNQAIDYGLVKGKIVYTDSTHVRANASNSKYENEVHEVIEDKNRHLEKVNIIRERHGKKPLKELESKVVEKSRKVSKTDPDSGFMNRSRKPRGFYHLDHRTVDSSYNIILDTFITAGNVHDSIPYLERLDWISETFDRIPQKIKYACADAAYFTNNVLSGLKERHLQPIIGAARYHGKKGKLSKYWFTFDLIEDVYVCKQGELLNYKTTNREGYSEYISNPEDCCECLYKDKCLTNDDGFRTIRRHVDEEYKDEARQLLKSEKGKALYDRRKETVERSFADSKEHHGHRYAHYRGKDNVQNEAYMIATAQNIKKIAMVLRSIKE